MVTLFSALSGHLSFNGAPLVGAEVVQTACNRGKKYTQRTITNEHGYFFFDKLTRRRTFIDYLPAEPLVSQEITLHVHGSKFLLWSFLKHSYDDDLSVECMHSNPTNASNFHFIGEVTGAEP